MVVWCVISIAQLKAVTFVHFNIFGKVRVKIGKFRSLVIRGIIWAETLVSRALMLSKPFALFGFKEHNYTQNQCLFAEFQN